MREADRDRSNSPSSLNSEQSHWSISRWLLNIARRCPTPHLVSVSTFIQRSCPCACVLIVIARRAAPKCLIEVDDAAILVVRWSSWPRKRRSQNGVCA